MLFIAYYSRYTPSYIKGSFGECKEEIFINYAENVDNVWYITDEPSKELKKAVTDWADKQKKKEKV